MSNGHTIEHVRRIWCDDTGECFEVGDDRDGLDQTEIRWMVDGKAGTAITFTDEQLPHLVTALQERLAEIQTRGSK